METHDILLYRWILPGSRIKQVVLSSRCLSAVRARVSHVVNMHFSPFRKNKTMQVQPDCASEVSWKKTPCLMCVNIAHKAVNNREPDPLAAIHAHATMSHRCGGVLCIMNSSFVHFSSNPGGFLYVLTNCYLKLVAWILYICGHLGKPITWVKCLHLPLYTVHCSYGNYRLNWTESSNMLKSS